MMDATGETGVELYELTRNVESLRRRYLEWRALRDQVRIADGHGSVPAELLQACRDFDASVGGGSASDALAPPPAVETLAADWDQIGDAVKTSLQDERERHWHQQGKMLRYSLIILGNRVAGLEASILEAPLGEAEADQFLLARLVSQRETLRTVIDGWEQARSASDVCSLAQIQAFIDDPYHEADKEHLERIVERGRRSELPLSLSCILLVWDAVTGEIASAELVPEYGNKAA